MLYTGICFSKRREIYARKPDNKSCGFHSCNIEEGSSRKSAKEYAHFLEISLGSSYELETHLLLAEALSYGNVSISKSILYKLSEEQKMLLAFIHKIKTDG